MSGSQSTHESSTPANLSCPHCNALLPLRAVFCSSCGVQVDQEKNEVPETHIEHSDNDAQEQETDTIRLLPLSQRHLKHLLSSQPLKDTTIVEQPTISSRPLSQEIEAPEQPSSSNSTSNIKVIEASAQEKILIPAEPSRLSSSANDPKIAKIWQRIPTTEVPKLPRITTPLPTVSYIPLRNIALYPTWSYWLWPTLIILSAVAAGLVNSVFTNTAVRPVIIVWFLFVCPGMVLVRFLHLKETLVEWILALALSFALDAIVAGIQLYARRWSPTGTLSVLIVFCLIAATIQLTKRTYATGSKIYLTIKAIKELFTVRANAKSALLSFKQLDVVDILLLLLPLFALFLWSISLQTISLNDMNNLGLISALSPRIIIALGILMISFALTLQRYEVRISLLAFQLICIILLLYATPNLIVEVPRFPPVYRSAGYTDYIMQTGTLNPQLDFYFNVPGFYVLSAFFTKAFGYYTILSYAGWAPLFYNLIYVGPMYEIFTSITTNKRLVWLSLLLFYLTKWIGQDAISPQGLNFFLYLVIIMILLKWLRIPPKKQVQLGKEASLIQRVFVWIKAPDPLSPSIEPWQRRGLLFCLILVFGLVVFSHPLTPLFTLLSVFILVVFRRCYPFWLPFLMLAMVAFWDFIIAGPYLSQHYNLTQSLGDLVGNVPKSVITGKLSGDQLYHVIATMRLYMTALFWFLAFLGGVKRLKQGNWDITLILLAIAGFPLLAADNYGNELLFRIYLFSEPFMCFFAASLFLNNSMVSVHKPPRKRTTFSWRTTIVIATNLFFLGSFFFTGYGDARVDYISYDEWNAVQYLYQIAPDHAFILEGWDYCPLFFKDYAKYDILSLSNALPEAVIKTNTNGIIRLVKNERSRYAYIIFSQEQQIYATSYDRLPDNTLQRLETRLLQTGKFKLVYHNFDAQILQYVGDTDVGT